MAKVHATRTFAPLQFEALEPHRFEDLVRDLIYGFRDWYKIEATGRGGSDDGYDIRAFESAQASSDYHVEGDAADDDRQSTIEGNKWMIQCKREKSLGPARVQSIVKEGVDIADAPYGYILAAPASFSKKTYDVFRKELSQLGVQEFYIFGRAELEDMLYMPKNDRILFAFFGVSLSSRKRSRLTEVRSSILIKNRLFTALKYEHYGQISESVLIRDINDQNYPEKEKYSDFDARPRWRDYRAVGLTAEGLRVEGSEKFAFIDAVAGTWDLIEEVNLLPRQMDDDERKQFADVEKKAAHFWQRLPTINKAKFRADGFLPYAEIQYVDKQGDPLHPYPHVFIDYGSRGPFRESWVWLEPVEAEIPGSFTDLKRARIFPKTLQTPLRGRVLRDRTIDFGSNLSTFRHVGRAHFADWQGDYDDLQAGDIVATTGSAGASQGEMEIFAELTYRWRGPPSSRPKLQWEMRNSDLWETESVATVLEFRLVYQYEIERS